jgi:hypothetical protein
VSATIIEVFPEQAAPPVCLFENPHGLVSLWDVYQIYAHNLLKVFDELRDIEIKISSALPNLPDEDEARTLSGQFLQGLADIEGACERLELASSQKQAHRIHEFIAGKITPGGLIAPMLSELRRRVREDLEDHAYFYVSEQVVRKCFVRDAEGLYQPKVACELMDASVVARFPAASDDIEATYSCFAYGCYPASMFHLMRIVEVGVLKVAKIARMKDMRPSWGAVLGHVEKIVLRTKYEDVARDVRPHLKMLGALLPQMQAIQRSWRNKFTHVEDKIIPMELGITEPIAIEILTAVEAFMRQLSHDLPPDGLE